MVIIFRPDMPINITRLGVLTPTNPLPAGFLFRKPPMLTQLSPPAAEPLTLAEAKLHLRVDFSDDDALITALIVTARQQAEHRTGRALVSQQWRLGLDQFPDDSLELPKPKLVSVQSVTYLDSNGTRQTLAGGDYEVITDGLVGRLVPAFGKSWPDCRGVSGVGAGELHLRLWRGSGCAAVDQGMDAAGHWRMVRKP